MKNIEEIGPLNFEKAKMLEVRLLGKFEISFNEAQALRRQAQETVEYIAGHMGEAKLQASFLGLPQVRAVFEAHGRK